MIQFNLLPDVKQEYLKARSTRRLVVVVSFVVSAVTLTVLVLLLISVKVVQQKSMKDADRDITKYSNQLKAIPDIDKILTVQNQLDTLTGLHDGKFVSSRVFSYLQQLTPSTVSLSTVTFDYTANTVTMSGGASALDQVNVYVDTIKQTKFTTTKDDTKASAFDDVVLTNFGRDDKGATFTLTFSFKPDIFKSTNDVKISVPHITTNPEQLLFQKAEDE
jgi:hypothetical protein